MSRDFSKIKKKNWSWNCVKQNRIFAQNFRKIVGENFVETVWIICNNYYPRNICETLVKLLRKFYRCLWIYNLGKLVSTKL